MEETRGTGDMSSKLSGSHCPRRTESAGFFFCENYIISLNAGNCFDINHHMRQMEYIGLLPAMNDKNSNKSYMSIALFPHGLATGLLLCVTTNLVFSLTLDVSAAINTIFR